ncbi:MAG: type II secretion system F family protein [Gammaproteobacteria bacterium]
MPLYRFKAATPDGELVEGQMEAADRESVVRKLQAQGHLPINAEPWSGDAARARSARTGALAGALRSRRIGFTELGLFTVELSTLLGAGLALDRALELQGELAEEGPLKKVIADVQTKVRGGDDLSAAMEAVRTPSGARVFSPFYLNMVRAGEAGGALGIALERLAEFQERARDLRDTVGSALVYPVLLLVFSVAALGLILGVVVPRLAAMFDDAGQELPLSTQFVVNAGALVHDWWWALIAVMVGGFMLVKAHLRDEEARKRWDGRLLRLPLAGDLIAKYEASRFTRTLGTLLGGGVPLIEALSIGREVVGNLVIRDGIAKAATRARAGQGLSGPLAETNVFPRLATHLLRVGEETGSMEQMLLRLADIYDREVRAALKRAVDLLGPAAILILGVLIAGIIMSVLSAVLSVNDLAF